MLFLRDYVFYRLANARILPRRFLPLQFFFAMLLTMTLWTRHVRSTVPGLTISLVVLGANLLGDGLRDLLDPRLG